MESLFSSVNSPKYTKTVVTYMAYFGSRYVGNDIQVLCGNIFDHPYVKTFTLFCIMYQASDNLNIATTMTLFFLTIQYFLSNVSTCKPYVDTTSSKNVETKKTIWPKNKDTDALGIKKPKPTFM